VAIARWTSDADGLFVQELWRRPTGIVVRDGDPLAGRAEVDLRELAHRTIVLHERAAQPARYDAVLAACATAGFTPSLVTPRLPFDPTFADVAQDRGVVLASVSVRPSLPDGLCWVALTGRALEERIDLMWNPSRTVPARDAFVAVARGLHWSAPD
jgi:hypothetical protein